MATTNQAFAKLSVATLVGSTVQAASRLVAADVASVNTMVNGGNAVRTDKVAFDLASAGFAKNGSARHTLSGTTPKNFDLTDLTANTPASYAGDTTFATTGAFVLYNDGAADVTISSGDSNGATFPLAGTSPTITVPAGKSLVIWQSSSTTTVDSTHKIITVTPTSGGSFVLGVAGA